MSHRQTGFTMLELLIALTITLVVALGALTTYDHTVDSFKQGGIAAAQQQGLRSAFEQIVSDLQKTGLHVNPDANPLCTDEAVEGAWDTAITVRGDFDGLDPVLSLVPETTLSGGIFDNVATGNDEIVTYALAKPDGTGPYTMKLFADVDDPQRDGSLEDVFIDNLDLTHADPPYTLYRITLSNDPADYGTEDFFIRTPVAENIGYLRFRYFDHAGNQLNTFYLPDTAEDIQGAIAGLETRARIVRVEVDMLGLAEDPDPNWRDWKDSNPATRKYRKFRLITDVRLRNSGTTGTPDVNPGEFGSL